MTGEDERLSEELFRRDGTHFCSIRVTLETDGVVCVVGQDMGPPVEKMWGDSDYEYWTRIPPEAAAKLAFALIRRHYAGREHAVEEIRALCVEAGVPHKFDTWA